MERLGKEYFAISRSGSDGHAFVFSQPPQKPDANGPGCRQPCLDDREKSCGCADILCFEAGESTPPGQQNNRRWSVYRLSKSSSK